MKLSHKLLYVSNNPLPGKPKLQSSCVFPKSILTLYWAQLLRRLFPPFLCFAFYIVEVKVLSLVTCFNWIAVSSQRGRQGISSSARADQRPFAVAGFVSPFHSIVDPDPWSRSWSCRPRGLTAMQQGGRLDPGRWTEVAWAWGGRHWFRQLTYHQVIQHHKTTLLHISQCWIKGFVGQLPKLSKVRIIKPFFRCASISWFQVVSKWGDTFSDFQ